MGSQVVGDRLTSDGARAYTWNTADRLAARGADTFSYDPLGRQTASTVGGTARTYAYNADGLLQSRTQGASTSFLWDPTSAVQRLVGAGTDTLVYGLGPLYLVKSDGTTRTLARDGQKSVRAELDDAGAVTAAFRYTAYGALEKASPATAVPSLLAYTSQLLDPSGLYYLRARWYDPFAGRFTTRDPLQGDPANPATLNTFGYAGANPLTMEDPSGLAFEREDLAAEGVSTPDSGGAVAQDDPLDCLMRCGGAGGPVGTGGGLRQRGGITPVLQGRSGVQMTEATLPRNHVVVANEITIQTSAGRIRIDTVVRDHRNRLYLVESKHGNNAKLTQHQDRAYDALRTEGGVFVGPRARDAQLLDQFIQGDVRVVRWLHR